MNNTKPNPVGVDKAIDRIQTYVYDNWATVDFDFYGRVYKHEVNGRVLPLFYTSLRNYKEVLLNDNLDGICFFNVSDSEQVSENGDVTSDCDIMFSINLSNLKGDTNRMDEEIKQELLETLYRFKGIFNIKEVIKGLESVYSEFNGVSDYFKNLQPYLHLRIKGEILYNFNLKCTS